MEAGVLLLSSVECEKAENSDSIESVNAAERT